MEKIYNKLVRDNIPDIIKKELYKKLLEECNELISVKTKDDIIDGTSDIFEVLSVISELEVRNIDKVIETSSQKRSKRGGFTKRIFLVKSTKKD